MKLYFQTRPHDVNAILVKQVLETRGVEVTIDCQTAFPGFETRSIAISNQEPGLMSGRPLSGVHKAISDYDIVMCLSGPSVTPAPSMDAVDIPYVDIESQYFLEAGNDFLGQDIFWVNHSRAHQLALLKPLQLKLARQVGFNIPDTLVSNDADDILAFCRAHGGNIVMKFLGGAQWSDGMGHNYVMMTTPLSEMEIITNREEVGYCPAIYQGYVEKAYEVRVTMMGATAIAARINSQGHAETAIDWRRHAQADIALPFEPMTLPADIHEKCRQLMKAMGLVYGCFDFIVDADGQYHFLEVNSAGKFLWKELDGEGFSMLHVFCEFLRSRDPDFIWDGREQYLARDLMAGTEHQLLMAETYAGAADWTSNSQICEA